MSRGIESTSNNFAIGLAFLQEAGFKAKYLVFISYFVVLLEIGLKIYANDDRKMFWVLFELLVAVLTK